MNTKKKHDEHTRQIALNSHIIGLDGIVLSTGEVNIFKKEKLISQPDNLLFDPSTKILYNIEYKCHDRNSQGHHAEFQLKRAEEVLNNLFPDYKTVNLYVHDGYKIEVVK